MGEKSYRLLFSIFRQSKQASKMCGMRREAVDSLNSVPLRLLMESLSVVVLFSLF